MKTLTYMLTSYLGLGLLFLPLGEKGYEWNAVKLYLNLYTAPSFLGIFLLIVSIVLTFCYFREFDVHKTKTNIPLKDLCSCCCSSYCQKNDDKS